MTAITAFGISGDSWLVGSFHSLLRLDRSSDARRVGKQQNYRDLARQIQIPDGREQCKNDARLRRHIIHLSKEIDGDIK